MKDKVFISSAQKELEAERLALLALLTTDPFLKDHVEPVLFERLPPPSRPTGKPHLDTLKNTMMEQRGTGFERMRAAMLDHGLDAHQLDQRSAPSNAKMSGEDYRAVWSLLAGERLERRGGV
jgi:hypothetical protein